MNLQKEPSISVHVSWRAGYGWEWDEDLDDVQEFDTWQDAQHWLRMRVVDCTLRHYNELRMHRNAAYRWISAIGQEFCLWKVLK